MMEEIEDLDEEILDEVAEEQGERMTLEVAADEGEMRLDAWLGKRAPGGLSRTRLGKLIEAKQVWVDGKLAKLRDKTQPGQRVEILIPPPLPAEPPAEEMDLDVVYEDSDVAVLNKPAGIIVHPTGHRMTGTLVNGMLHRFKDLGGIGGVERPGIVHRLDKDTSGLMVVAKNDAAMIALRAAFQEFKVEKIYWALTHNTPRPPAGTVRTQLGRHPFLRQQWRVVEKGGKDAVTHYAVKAESNGVAWLEVRLETGRTHQIRVHCKHLNCAILGDPVYGWRACDKELEGCPARQMLHAFSLSFPHPRTKKRMVFERTPPEDMAGMMKRCGFL